MNLKNLGGDGSGGKALGGEGSGNRSISSAGGNDPTEAERNTTI